MTRVEVDPEFVVGDSAYCCEDPQVFDHPDGDSRCVRCLKVVGFRADGSVVMWRESA